MQNSDFSETIIRCVRMWLPTASSLFCQRYDADWWNMDDMLFEIKGKKVAAHLSRYFLAEHQCLHAGQIALCFLAHAAIWYTTVCQSHSLVCVTQSHIVFGECLAFCRSTNRFSAHTLTQMLVSGVACWFSLETGDLFPSLQMEQQQPGCQLNWTPVVIYSCMNARPDSGTFSWTATESFIISAL